MKKRTSSKPNACFVLKRRRARNWPKAELKNLKDKQKDSPRYIRKTNPNLRQFAITFLFHALVLPFKFLMQ
jgi:hypothetical protein